MQNPIEQLNFEVILKDEKFKASVQADLEAAKDLNRKLSDILNIKKTLDADTTKSLINMEKVTAAAAKTAQEKAKQALQEQKVRTEIERTTAAARAHTGAVRETNTALMSTHSLMHTLSQLTGITFSVIGLRRFLSTLIEITGQFEVQRMALRNMLQDVDGADKIFEDLYRFSSESTYRFSELAKYAKQLAAFNIDKSNLLETTKMLGDVASGVGVSMDRLILAYGHVKSSGFLRGIQLRSFSQNGVPVLEELSKILTEVEGKTVSLGDVFDKMMKREIPFEMVEQAFKNMTSEGGKFYQMQEVLARTLSGQINILKGRWENLLAAIGNANSGVLKDTVSWMSNLVSSMDNVGRLIKTLIIGFGTYQATLVIVTGITQGLATAMNVGLVGAIKNVAKSLIASVVANPYVALAAAVAVATAGIVSLVTKLSEVEKIQKVVDKATSDYNTSLATEVAELDRLFTKLKLAKEGTEEFDSARRAIETRFGPYLQELRNEGVEVTHLAETYELLKGKIESASRARALEASGQSLKTQFEQSTKAINDEVEKTLGNIGKKLTASQKEVLSSYVFGIVNENDEILKDLQNKLRQGSGEGGPAFVNYRSLESLREQYMRIKSAYDAGMGVIEERFRTLDTLTNKGGGDAGEQYYDIKSIIEGIKKYDDEISQLTNKAAISKITETERNRLTQLREARKEQADLYKEIMGVDYDRKTSGTKSAKLDPLTKAVNDIINNTGDDIDKELLKLFDLNLDEFDEDNKRLEKTLNEREKAFVSYVKFLGQIADSKMVHGEGSLLKLTGFISEFSKEDFKATSEYNKHLNELKLQFDQTSDAFKDGKRNLDKWLASVRDANKAKFNEKVRGLADDIFKEQMEGFDLTNWNDKTILQINAIKEAIKKVEIPEDIKKELEGDTEAAEALLAALSQLKQRTLENTVDPEMFKKVSNEAKRIAGYLGNAASKMKAFADATGNTKLGDTAEIVGMLAQNMQAAAEGAESWGGWWGAIIGGVTDLFDQMTTGLTEAAKKAHELDKSVKEIRSDARLLEQTSLFSEEGVFGTDIVKNMSGAVEAMKNLRGHMKSLGDPEIKRALSFWEKMSVVWRLVYNPNHISQEELPNQGKLSEVMQRYGLNVYDQYGNLDPNSIREIIKLFGDEDGVLEQLAKDAEAYANAMDMVNNAMQDVFGEIASSFADNIVDRWVEAGDAALDYADIMDDVARKYANMLIQSAILNDVLNPEEAARVADMFMKNDVEGAMAAIADDMGKIAEMEPVFDQILTTLDPYFNRQESQSSSGSLGSGIKGITEDTANLLASYINAMRADLSSIRMMQESGWQNISSIGSAIPTLNEYMAQVAANTFDSAQNTQRILSELQSVIGAPGTSGMVVRVEGF